MTSVRELMTPAPETIGAEQSIDEANRRMRRAQVRHLPVLSGAQLVGLLSDRDARLVESVAKGEHVLVGDVMTPEPFVVHTDEDLKDVVAAMAARKLGSAIVVEAGKVVGIFTTTDALHLLLRHLVLDDVRGF